MAFSNELCKNLSKLYISNWMSREFVARPLQQNPECFSICISEDCHIVKFSKFKSPAFALFSISCLCSPRTRYEQKKIVQKCTEQLPGDLQQRASDVPSASHIKPRILLVLHPAMAKRMFLRNTQLEQESNILRMLYNTPLSGIQKYTVMSTNKLLCLK